MLLNKKNIYMKNTISFVLFILSLMIIPQMNIQAQESDSTDTAWKNNWYIEAGGGAQVLFSSDVGALLPQQRFTPAISLSVGKWFSPFLGVRLQMSGYSLNGNTNPLTDSKFADGYNVADNVNVRPDGSYRHYLRYANFQVDVRTSLFSLFAGVKPRHWDIIPSLGIGYLRTFAYKGTVGTNNFAAHLAIMGKYSINKNWDVNLEIVGSTMPNSFDGRTTKTALEGALSGTVGVTYNFNSKPSKTADKYFANKAEPQKPRVSNDKSQIATQLSELNFTLEKLNQRLENVEKKVENLEIPPAVEVQTVVEKVLVKREPFVLTSILFNLSKSEPIKRQEINFVNVVNYLQGNPDAKIILSGYGDKGSGTAEANLQISKKRVEAVRTILIDNGIDSNRIEIRIIGDDSQPYQINELNRVVVITATE
jgi:outer membrane protein OmpA-like peptidoglycan-associated protein